MKQFQSRIFLRSKFLGIDITWNGEKPRATKDIFINYVLMIPSKQLSGFHCHIINYVFISHNLTLSSSLRRRIGELVPLVV